MLLRQSIIASFLLGLASSILAIPIAHPRPSPHAVGVPQGHASSASGTTVDPKAIHITCTVATAPTVEQFMQGMKHLRPNKAIYYSSPIDAVYRDKVQGCANSLGLTSILELVATSPFKAHMDACEQAGRGTAGYLAFWRNASIAMARNTRGIAYILLAPGASPWEHSFWQKHEAPELRRNGVTVKRVDLCTIDINSATTLKI